MNHAEIESIYKNRNRKLHPYEYKLSAFANTCIRPCALELGSFELSYNNKILIQWYNEPFNKDKGNAFDRYISVNASACNKAILRRINKYSPVSFFQEQMLLTKKKRYHPASFSANLPFECEHVIFATNKANAAFEDYRVHAYKLPINSLRLDQEWIKPNSPETERLLVALNQLQENRNMSDYAKEFYSQLVKHIMLMQLPLNQI